MTEPRRPARTAESPALFEQPETPAPARRIWKYPFTHRSDSREGLVTFTERLPQGARVLSAAPDPNGPSVCVWATVVTDAPLEPRTFVVVPTGGREPTRARFVDTVIYAETVGHVYEILS